MSILRPEVLEQFRQEFAISNWTETFIPPTSRRKDTLHRYAQEGHLIYLGTYRPEGIFILGDQISHLFAPSLTTLRHITAGIPDEDENSAPFREFRKSFAQAPNEAIRRAIQAEWEIWHQLHLHRPLPPRWSFDYLLTDQEP